MITLDSSRFTASAARFVDKLGLNAVDVMRKESGELMKTLVRVTPPDDPAKTRKSIDTGYRSKFEEASDQSDRFHAHMGRGNGDIAWYAWTSRWLYGVAKEADKRDADADEIYKLAITLTGTGRQKLPFKHTRTTQQVLLSQTVLVKKGRISEVIKRIQGHVGRLKAGWLVGWDEVNPTGSNMPPGWVMRHKQGARGSFVNELAKKDFPSVTIGNSALGVSDRRVAPLAQKALDIRAGAMMTNFRLFFSGKKELSAY